MKGKRMQEAAPGVFRVTQVLASRFFKFTANIYIISGENGLVFDAGFGTQKAVANLTACIREIEKSGQNGNGCKITRVLPSHGHWDHFSGLKGLKEKAGLNVLLTRKMAGAVTSKSYYIRSMDLGSSGGNPLNSLIRRFRTALYFKIAGVTFYTGPYQPLEEKEILTVGDSDWQVFSLPGHCDDDVVLYNPKSGILLGGDIVLEKITTWLGPYRSSLSAYMKSLEFLLTLPGLSLILPAHGGPVTDPISRINYLIQHRNKRTRQVLDIVRYAGAAGIDFNSIFKRIYPAAKIHRRFLMEGWMRITLDELIKQDQIIEKLSKKRIVFIGK